MKKDKKEKPDKHEKDITKKDEEKHKKARSRKRSRSRSPGRSVHLVVGVVIAWPIVSGQFMSMVRDSSATDSETPPDELSLLCHSLVAKETQED